MTKRLLVAVLFLLAAAAAAHAQAPSAPVVDHFKCYFTEAPQLVRPVELEDQFDHAKGQVERVTDLRLIRLCNPVQKATRRGRVTPITNPEAHLTLYLINPQPILPRRVWIRNQFGRQRLFVRDAQVLAVPTGKTKPTGTVPPPTPPIPVGLDHYKCYGAGGRRINAVVKLKDQFHEEELVRVLEPRGFCNPVQKTIHDPTGVPIITPITNPRAHLACYTITPTPNQADVIIHNQFELRPLNVFQADILCVPSVKLAWAEVAPPTAADFHDKTPK